jgi:hypothetical protein
MKCATGDSMVGVNTTKKMYMTQAQMKAQSKGMTAAQTQAMMTKNHVSMMCMTKAKTMGASAYSLEPKVPGGIGDATDPGAVKPK